MKISKFTFAILAYNQANIIGETLESIKYQIEKYGDNRIFKIIVTDDFSKDNTLLTVRKWIEKNGGLFKEVKILTNQSNMGTVYNYNRIMENIDEESFKVIAGDDLIGPNNIFEVVENNTMTVDTYPFIRLEDGKITYRKDYLYDYYYKYKFYSPSKNLAWMKDGDFIHTPSTFYSKKLYSLSVAKKFNEKFFLFEDDPTFYSFFNYSPEVKVKFNEKPLILYRYTTASTSTVPNDRFLIDWKKLQEQYIKDTTGIRKIFYKLRVKTDFSKKININKVYTKGKKVYRMLVISVFFRDEFRKFFKEYESNVKEFEKFYGLIYDNNRNFLEE